MDDGGRLCAERRKSESNVLQRRQHFCIRGIYLRLLTRMTASVSQGRCVEHGSSVDLTCDLLIAQISL